ncbi:hypothetical protein GQ457_04G010460 [Hibiscus cannabinus]
MSSPLLPVLVLGGSEVAVGGADVCAALGRRCRRFFRVLYQLWNQKPVELSVLVSFGVGISSRSKDTVFIKFFLLKYFGGTLTRLFLPGRV